jgi:NTE family protein
VSVRGGVFIGLLLLELTASAQQPEREPVAAEPAVRIGLALSGGGALGFAHIGVLKVLEREGIPIVAISGTSMGSMVGGAYAAGYGATQVESLAVHADWSRLFSSSVPFGAQYLPERSQVRRYLLHLRQRNFVPSLPEGLLPLQNVEFLLIRLFADIEYNTGFDFDNLPIPYRAVAVDLTSGKLQVMGKGRLEQAIRASIAIPGVFAPEKLNGMELVDGGVQRLLPVGVLDGIDPNLDIKIAVLTVKHNPETGVSLIDITSRSIDLAGAEDLEHQKGLADVLIQPNVDSFTHSDFARAPGLIAAGESAAETALPRIRELIGARAADRRSRSIKVRELPTVRTIRFEGLHVTRVGTIRREITTGRGKLLQFSRLIGDLERLFNTGLFEDVNYRLDDVGHDSVDVTFVVQERAYGFYSLGVRYDNIDDLNLGLEVGQGNLGGTGASVRAALDLGNPNEVRLGLTGTRLYLLPFGYRLDGYLGSITHSFYAENRWRSSYSVSHRGGLAEAGYILGHDAFFNFGLNGYRATYRVPAGFPTDSVHAANPEWIIGPSFRLDVNTFGDVDFPQNGVQSQLDVTSSATALKATRQFVRLGYSGEDVAPLSSRWLLRSGLDIGLSFGDLPWAEQFHTGGAGFIGFSTDEFTSAQRAVLKLGVDFRLFRLFGQSNYPVYVQMMGNVGTFEPWNRLVSDTDRFSPLHWGLGTGARTNTPIGPAQMLFGVGDFGTGLKSKPVTLAFIVSIGHEFRYTR